MKTYKPARNILNQQFGARIGRVLEVYQQNKDNEDDKRLYCSIEVFPAGQYKNVPLWGGGFDFDTEQIHGFFCPPRENQLILILFLNGNFENPVSTIPLPFPYDHSFVDKYYDMIESVDDISLFHYSGTRIILRNDGSVDIQKRIEESDNEFVNHTLKIEFDYDSNNEIRKKTITDVDNNHKIELLTDDVIVTDAKSQVFQMHSTDDEEYIKTIDKAGQYCLLDSSNGAEKIEIKDKAGQQVLLDSTSGTEKILVKKSATQYYEMNNNSNDIKGSLLNLLSANESFVKGDTWKAGFTAFFTALSTLTPGTTAQNATAITAIATAASTLNGILANMLSSKIKGE